MNGEILKAECVLITDHGIGLACTCRSISEDCGIESVKDSFDEGMGSFEIDLNGGSPTF